MLAVTLGKRMRCSEKISGTSKVTQLVAAGVGVQTHVCFHPASVPPYKAEVQNILNCF